MSLLAYKLAFFYPFFQAVEAKEKQDEQVGLPGKGGKAKGKKAQMAEVLPSPSGKRVIPRVTIEMKAEAEKKNKRKIKVMLMKTLYVKYLRLIST